MLDFWFFVPWFPLQDTFVAPTPLYQLRRVKLNHLGQFDSTYHLTYSHQKIGLFLWTVNRLHFNNNNPSSSLPKSHAIVKLAYSILFIINNRINLRPFKAWGLIFCFPSNSTFEVSFFPLNLSRRYATCGKFHDLKFLSKCTWDVKFRYVGNRDSLFHMKLKTNFFRH